MANSNGCWHKHYTNLLQQAFPHFTYNNLNVTSQTCVLATRNLHVWYSNIHSLRCHVFAWQSGSQAESNGNHDFGPLEGGNSGIFGGSGAGSFEGSAGGGGFGGSFGNAPTENGNTAAPAMVCHAFHF